MGEEKTPSSTSPEGVNFNPANPASVAAAAAAALTFVRAPDFKTIFSDLARSRVGNGIVGILFSRVTHPPGAAILTNIVEDQAEIVMTWTQFKMVIQLWSSLLSAIETEIGPIPLPQSFQVSEDNSRAIVRTLGFAPATAD